MADKGPYFNQKEAPNFVKGVNSIDPQTQMVINAAQKALMAAKGFMGSAGTPSAEGAPNPSPMQLPTDENGMLTPAAQAASKRAIAKELADREAQYNSGAGPDGVPYK